MKTSTTCKPVLMMGTALSALLFAGSVHAWATVTPNPAVAPPTGTVAVTGSHFSPNSLVEVFLKWKRCSVTTDAQGAFSCTFKVPKVLEPGLKKIWTVNRANRRWVSTPFTVRTDWGNEAFDAGRTRYNPYENVINRANVGQLQNLWTAPGTLQIVADGLVFIKPAAFPGIQALHETDGTERWQLTAEQFGAKPLGNFASAGGRLYAGRIVNTETVDDEGVPGVDALRTEDGGRLWRTSWRQWLVSPALTLATSGETPDTVYVSWIGHDLFEDYTHSWLGAHSATDGHDIWHNDSGTWGVPLVMSGLMYLNGGSREFYGDYFRNTVFQASDGTVVRDTGAVLCHYDYGYCFNTHDSETPVPPPPPFVNVGFGLVVQAQASDRWFTTSTLSVVKGGDLTPLWTWTAPVGTSMIAAPALTPSTLYVAVRASDQLRLYALKTANGAVLWNRAIEGAGPIQPTVANGVIYLGNRAYDARNGDLLWTSPALIDTVSPIVVNGRLYANQVDGNVSAWGL